MKKKLLGLFLMGGITFGAMAQTTPATPATAKAGWKAEKSDRKRIKEGVKTGELTKAEAKDLREDNKGLKNEVKVAKADGKVDKAERRVLAKDQSKFSKEIYHKKHNARKRA
ncbi:hypothetical protein EZJ43_02585 [Pedobacter changchengzhani]|uniref:DUF4890 domain-containing protein n=1 Tax=Pedobacter changchengzhani TaxID=2529274 RepID=A0A4R5MQL3_9SPHI|nr:hypothetical protein [Pedobacter changchengzhani]TDG37996.1 hypothetical protein EZJ43_02585 [Pedobacter changchengzhani]